ncbi:MAG: hypothetical protein ABI612_07960 [Betaproteobacteria bacterium]
MNKKYVIAMLAACVVVLSACSKKEEAPPPPPPVTAPTPAPEAAAPAAGVTVGTISLGTAVGADKKVTKAGESFDKKDTIYASVDTIGSGTATIKAKWTYKKDGTEAVVHEETQTITPSGPATSEFHVSKPDGWPAGDYQVEVFVDDKSAGTKTFTVK